MSLRVFSIAAVCCVIAPVVVSALPVAVPPQAGLAVTAVAATTADPVGAHAAIAQAQERLAEIDATISVLQDEADRADAGVRQRAHDAVAGLRAIRDTYRKEIDGVVAQGRQITADQLTVARAALTAPWTQFEHALDEDVVAVKLDAAQRKAIIEARLKAEQAYWQGVATDLQASATAMTAEQRAAIDARIARVKTRLYETQTRLTKLTQASQNAWVALKKGLAGSRQIFDETYNNGR